MTLQPFAIPTPCDASWEAMRNDGSARFCQSCQKHVVDLAALTEREIRGLATVTGGRFCVNQTVRNGRLVTRPEPPTPSIPTPLGRFVVRSVVAAGVLGAAYGSSAAALPPVPPAVAAPLEPSGVAFAPPAPAPRAAAPELGPQPSDRQLRGEPLVVPAIVSRILFARGQAELTAQSLTTLDEVAHTLATFSWIPGVVIQAGTSGDEGSPVEQEALGQARAEAVRARLVALGVVAQRLRVATTVETQDPTSAPSKDTRAAQRAVAFRVCESGETCR